MAAIRMQPLTAAAVVPLACACCRRKGEMRSAASVVHNGRRVVRDTSHGFLSLVRFSSVTHTGTKLARQLAPPRAPEPLAERIPHHTTRILRLVFCGLVVLLAGRVINAVEAVPLAGAALVGALLYAAWLTAMVASGAMKRAVRRETVAHGRALERWRALYHCGSCGRVFAYGEARCLAPGQVRAYLYEDREDAA